MDCTDREWGSRASRDAHGLGTRSGHAALRCSRLCKTSRYEVLGLVGELDQLTSSSKIHLRRPRPSIPEWNRPWSPSSSGSGSSHSPISSFGGHLAPAAEREEREGIRLGLCLTMPDAKCLVTSIYHLLGFEDPCHIC